MCIRDSIAQLLLALVTLEKCTFFMPGAEFSQVLLGLEQSSPYCACPMGYVICAKTLVA